MRTKEVRLALICYGGVSLAVYMHGIVKEIWKLLQASQAAHASEAVVELTDTAAVYAALLEEVAPNLRLRVLSDIIAGASAGGLNGIFLAHAITTGPDIEPLRDLWLNNADIDTLLYPESRTAPALSRPSGTPLSG